MLEDLTGNMANDSVRSFRPPSWAVVAVISTLTVVAAIIAYWLPYEFPDEKDYWTLARNLVSTGVLALDGKTPSAYRPPLIAWILAPIVAIGASMSVARLCFVVFFAASGILCAVFLRRFFPQHPLLQALGIAFVLCNPVYLLSAGNLYPQQVLAPLFLAALFCACHRPTSISANVVRSILIAACTAASVLASAPSLFSLLPIWTLLVVEDWQDLRLGLAKRAIRSALAVLVMIILVSPYVYRNYRNVHSGIYLSLNSGINLLLGNSPKTTPDSGIDVDISPHQERLADENEFDANRRLTQAALENIQKDPLFYARLYGEKFLAGFSNLISTVTHGFEFRGSLFFGAYMIFVWAGVLLLLLIARLGKRELFTPMNSKMLNLLLELVLVAYVCNLAGYAIFFNRLRFRIPLDVAIALVSAAGWSLLLLKIPVLSRKFAAKTSSTVV